MPKKANGNSSSPEPSTPSEETILGAFEKVFKTGDPSVRRFQPSGLRYVNLDGGAILVEQNPNKTNQWAMLARGGHQVAWVIRDSDYLVSWTGKFRCSARPIRDKTKAPINRAGHLDEAFRPTP